MVYFRKKDYLDVNVVFIFNAGFKDRSMKCFNISVLTAILMLHSFNVNILLFNDCDIHTHEQMILYTTPRDGITLNRVEKSFWRTRRETYVSLKISHPR